MTKAAPDAALKKIEKIAKTKLGLPSLRPGQGEVVSLLLDGHDVLAILPTGFGKSAIYQIAAAMLDGATVVVSPLLALQKDQVDAIAEKKVGAAEVVNSTVGKRAAEAAFDQAERGRAEFLFLAPEQLAKAEVVQRLEEMEPSLLVVDEAHCVTEWGQDFRPEYGRLGGLVDRLRKKRKSPLRVLALTATASPRVAEEIEHRLHLRKVERYVGSFARQNIHLSVERCPDEEGKHRRCLALVETCEKPAIVYVATHAHAEDLARELREQNINALHYHGGMKSADRVATQDRFMEGEVDVVVATNAFGMGVDKPDVRIVVHYDVPASIDAFYQEVGRAGRDGKPSRAVLLYREADAGRMRAQASPGAVAELEVRKVVEVLREGGDHSEKSIIEASEVTAGKVRQILGRLEDLELANVAPGGDIEVEELPEDVVEQVVQRQEEFRNYRIGRVELMKAYAESSDCRRGHLLTYFGEKLGAPCRLCDNCDGGVVERVEARRAQVGIKVGEMEVGGRVVHGKFGEGTVKAFEGENILVMFDRHGEKSLALAVVKEKRLLKPAANHQVNHPVTDEVR